MDVSPSGVCVTAIDLNPERTLRSQVMLQLSLKTEGAGFLLFEHRVL